MIYVNSVSLSYSKIAIEECKWYYNLCATVSPSNATCKSVHWTSSNPNVAAVNKNTGYIYAVGKGTATITATSIDGSNKSASCEVVIPGIFVNSVDVAPSAKALNVGETTTLSATVNPADATTVPTIKWRSGSSAIAEVNENTGVVTAKAPGTANIYAESQDGSYKRDYCTVTVMGYYNIINKETGKALNISGSYLVNLSNGKNVTLYSKTGSDEQIWVIDRISNDEICYIKSYIDQEYGLNAYRSPTNNYNCNIRKIIGNETDAAVYFIPQSDGSYKIKLANHSNYYLTATGSTDGADIRWQPEDNAKKQHWELVNFDFEQREAEKVEYHIIPYSDINLEDKRALQVDMNTPNDPYDPELVNKIIRLENDEPLELATFSYINKQKWQIKGVGSERKIYTVHGDNYCLCKKDNTNTVYVSDNSSLESDLTIIPHNASANLFKIKLTNSNLYLTTSDEGIKWNTANTANDSTQVWKFVAKPSNIRNGCDSVNVMNNHTVRAVCLDNNDFVIRYYKLLSKFKNKELRTIKKETDPIGTTDASLLENTITSLKSVGVNFDDENFDYLSYVNTISNDDVEFHSNNFSENEKNSLIDCGTDIVIVYQNSAKKIAYFSEKHAKLDAFCALVSAKLLNQPSNSAIYFAVDCDIYGSNLEIIENYFETIKHIINGQYKIGVYGNGSVCYRIKQEKEFADYSWLGHATGHSGYSDYDSLDNNNTYKYDIKQAEEIFYNDAKFDDCISPKQDYGQRPWEKQSN